MDFAAVFDNLPLYFQGLGMTLQLVAISLACGMVLAIPLALVAASRNPLISALPKAYIYFFRGTPLLVQLFMIYHGSGQFKPYLDAVGIWWFFRSGYLCCLLAFILNTAGYTAEIIRGAIEQTAFGEIEAARAAGMSKPVMYRRIVLPSAFRRALPAYGNEVIFMLHGSVIASIVAIVDLLGAGRIVNSRYYVPFESFIAAGLFYLCITFTIVWVFKLWEKHWYAHLRPREETTDRPTGAAALARMFLPSRG
jgi:arginine/ornithine transport system permease protein